MNEVQMMIDECRKHGRATLRGIWPGRGKAVTERRASAKKAFGDSQIVKEIDGETKITTVVYDKQKGVYLLS